MFVANTITKKILENIIKNTFLKYKEETTSYLLDSFKNIGFLYSTNAGLSINIEDLKTPDIKNDFLKNVANKVSYIGKEWRAGYITDVERFQFIMDNWNVTTESLKNRIIDYFETYEPANSLYIMTFSGAKGNMSQVRQLIGMRGLMADQSGKIISLPILTNFREGLSSVDYIISSYGARKGTVDTALKTAVSGYLTRKLIYVAQDLIIRRSNCFTNNGILIFLNKDTDITDIIGRILISTIDLKNYENKYTEKNFLLTEKILKEQCLENKTNLLKIRTPLTCNIANSICQLCYGLDLGKNNIINLGEVVGIIAAHSIGEPGTQLTMRTFHTGGIFRGENLKEIQASFSGYIEIPFLNKELIYRTSHGEYLYNFNQDEVTKLKFKTWKGEINKITIPKGFFLKIIKSKLIKKNEVLFQDSGNTEILLNVKKVPIFCHNFGQVFFVKQLKKIGNLFQKKNFLEKKKEKEGVVWIRLGKLLKIPKKAKINLFQDQSFIRGKFQLIDQCIKTKVLKPKKSIAFLKLSSPYSGLLIYKSKIIILISKKKKYQINLSKIFPECIFYKSNNISEIYTLFNLIILTQNFQFLDTYTIFAVANICSQIKTRFTIYASKKYNKSTKPFYNIYFLITESDIWKINTNLENTKSYFHNGLAGLQIKNKFTSTISNISTGFLIDKEGYKFIYQKSYAIYIDKKVIFSYMKNDKFIYKNELLFKLLSAVRETKDIVQGLPKIERILEARSPSAEKTSKLTLNSGVFMDTHILTRQIKIKHENDLITCIYKYNSIKYKNISLKKKKKFTRLLKTFYTNSKPFVIYEDNAWLIEPLQLQKNEISLEFLPYSGSEFEGQLILNNKDNKELQNKNIQSNVGKILEIYIKNKDLKTTCLKVFKTIPTKKKNDFYSINLKKDKLKLENFDINNIYAAKNHELNYMILATNKDHYYFLKKYSFADEYVNKSHKRNILKGGAFLDIGEPMTIGSVDPNELLQILFEYHSSFNGKLIGLLKSLNKFQLVVVNSIQSIYLSQDVQISSKHIELIIRQLTNRVLLVDTSGTPYHPTDIIHISLLLEILKTIFKQKIDTINKNYSKFNFQPLYSASIQCSLFNKPGFLSSAGFQQTGHVLANAAIQGKYDWLLGLKERLITGGVQAAGTNFKAYKSMLDKIAFLKYSKIAKANKY